MASAEFVVRSISLNGCFRCAKFVVALLIVPLILKVVNSWLKGSERVIRICQFVVFQIFVTDVIGELFVLRFELVTWRRNEETREL